MFKYRKNGVLYSAVIWSIGASLINFILEYEFIGV